MTWIPQSLIAIDCILFIGVTSALWRTRTTRLFQIYRPSSVSCSVQVDT